MSVDGTAKPGCWHPRSCARCQRVGLACGRHYVGDPGHERCTGTNHENGSER